MILVTKWYGCFLCVEGEIKEAALFPKDPAAIADRMEMIKQGEILEEERNLGRAASQVAERRLSEIGKFSKFDSSFITPEAHGFTLDIYREATIDLARRMAKSEVGPDVYLGHAVRAHDDLVFTNNMLSERLHEWYSLHFPELEEVLSSEAYVSAIIERGHREDILASFEARMDSIGADIDDEDLASIQTLATVLKESMAAKKTVESYINSRMKVIAPNVTALVGPVIGARLTMQAGSLVRLASLPSGTIQLLGAEKALFRHLKKKTRPPKHGTLFQHPMVHNAPAWQRGPIARAIAAKLSVAARADAFTGNDIAASLKEQLDRRVEEIRMQRQSPPKKHSGKRKKSNR
ncbi:MAG: ribosomal biogenesis protein [Methanobacteriota archaeon]|nr:MAG: ribosomal biogenesis protein [Euryarchaeota archaeon]